MFKSKEVGKPGPAGGLNSVLGQGSQLNGNLRVEGSIRVDGEFEGRLVASDRLVVGQAGFARADLEAREIVVSGRVEGKLIAQERVELQTGARVEGEVWAQSLVIADGVRFSGNCRMGDEAKEHWRAAVRGWEGAPAEHWKGREGAGTGSLSVLDSARARNR